MNNETYPIKLTDDVFGEENETLAGLLKTITKVENPKILLVADVNVVNRTEGLGTKIGRYLQAHGITLAASPVVISGSEKAKYDDFHSGMRIASAAISAKVGVNDVMLVLGGGSMLDVAGWAAAQVRGGINVVRMPTSVAAMIDGAYSEYAALDIGGVKDSMRVASKPAAVVVDTAFASTVLDGVWRAGFAEAVRLAAVYDANFLKRLSELSELYNARETSTLDEVVRSSIELRQKNGATTFGLWSALRLESMSGYKLPHGYAVAIGVVIDAYYAQLRGLITEEERDFLCATLDSCGAMDCAFYSRRLIAQVDSLICGLDALRLSAGSEAIVLPKGLGNSIVEEKPDRDTMKSALNMLK